MNIMLCYLLVTVLFCWPWYTIWLIALVPLVRDKQLRILAVLFSFISLSKYLVLHPLFNWQQPTLPQPWLEIWQTLGLLSIPWAYALYILVSRWRSIPQIRPHPPIYD